MMQAEVVVSETSAIVNSNLWWESRKKIGLNRLTRVNLCLAPTVDLAKILKFLSKISLMYIMNVTLTQLLGPRGKLQPKHLY